MTRYTVVWGPEAEAELAAVWLAALDRAAVTSTVMRIDGELGYDAIAKGIELREGLRTLTVGPLTVAFTASEQDRLAEIVLVRLT